MKASSKEIVISALKSKRSDRPPIMLLTSLHAIRVLGLTVPEVRVSSELNFKAQAKALEIYEYDNVFQYWDLAMFLELMGGKVRPIKDSSPSIVEPLIKGPEHLSSLKIPDLKAESPLKESLKCLEKLVKTFGDDIAICTGAVGPFTFAGVLRGIESFMVDLSKNKDFALQLID
ncbi:MAG: uroporphyrinogen decarboxylase family protein [Candidatus Bathyarchaeia archaeon]